MQNALLKANQEAGKHLLAPHSLQINHKADLFDLVTDMDLRVQELLRSAYARILPEAAFLGGGYERHPCTGATLLAGGPH